MCSNTRLFSYRWMAIMFVSILVVSLLVLYIPVDAEGASPPPSGMGEQVGWVNGTLLDAEGQPIANAHVNVEPLLGLGTISFGTETNAEGEFTFELSSGEYILKEATTNEPVTSIYTFNRTFMVNAGEVMNIGTYVAVPLVRVSGIVMAGDEPAIYPWIYIVQTTYGRMHAGEGSIDGSGQFTIWVTPGEYHISVEGSPILHGRGVEVTVTEAGLTDVVIAMLPYSVILTGKVVNESGEGLVSKIEIKSAGGELNNWVHTNLDGTYVIGSDLFSFQMGITPMIVTNDDNSRTGYAPAYQQFNVNFGDVQVPDIVTQEGIIFDGVLLQSSIPYMFKSYEVYRRTVNGLTIITGGTTDQFDNFEFVVPVGDVSNLEMWVQTPYTNGIRIVRFPEVGTSFGNVELDDITSEPVLIHIKLNIQLFLGSMDTSLGNLLRGRLEESSVDSTVQQLTVVLKENEHDPGITYTCGDGICANQNGALAKLDDYGQLTAKLDILNVPEGVTIIEISGGSMKKQIISNLDLTTNTILPTVVLLPGDIDGDGSIAEEDYSSWLALYVRTRTGTATVSERIAADMTMDGIINNLDFSLWLASRNRQ